MLLASSCGATCGGGGGGGAGGLDSGKVYMVPWRMTTTEADLPKEGLVLSWIPANIYEFSGSPLRFSKTLSLFGARCVNMAVVDAKSQTAGKLLHGEKLPVVVLTAVDGTTVGKVESHDGVLNVADVEQLLQQEISKRDLALKEKLDDARNKCKSGQTTDAIQEFQDVLGQRCLFPKRAREAQRELTKLGISQAATIYDDPHFDDSVSLKVQKLMDEGLKAELKADYPAAQRCYSSAHELDPSDPAPLRFLGEVYRHHIGDWVKARETFEAILSMPADPISRAVALHGLGKMTIHEGEFKKGLALMEKSVEIFPLAMAYRNLAVYWNSEGDPDKANYYTQQAVKLSPKDPYNLVFATVFTAANGHPEEALKIATANEGLMPASYNLAAIYAQLGRKDKALQLLKRHFFEYERYKAVREKEMMEARVDFVFKSLVKDPDFLALTNLADGKLPMRMSDHDPK